MRNISISWHGSTSYFGRANDPIDRAWTWRKLLSGVHVKKGEAAGDRFEMARNEGSRAIQSIPLQSAEMSRIFGIIPADLIACVQTVVFEASKGGLVGASSQERC